MSLGLSSYSSLNGLGLITGGTSGYGYGGYYTASDAYTENAKKSISNNYDIQTTQQSYSNLQNTESMSFTMHCQVIQNMLQSGRSDDALLEFNNMVDEMANLSQYANYNEQQLKTLAQNQYKSATGSTLLGDISKYGNSSFTTGFTNSIPIIGLLFQSNSKNDLVSEVTGTKKSTLGSVAKIGGAAVGGAAFGTLAVATNTVRKAAKGNVLKDLASKLGSTKKAGKVALIGAAVGAACLGVKWLVDKVTGATHKASA